MNEDNSKKPVYIGIDMRGVVVALCGAIPSGGYDAKEIAEALLEMHKDGLRVEMSTVGEAAPRLYREPESV